MKPFKNYKFHLFNIGKPVARAIMKAHKKRGISRSAWLLEAVAYKLIKEGITVNTDNYGPIYEEKFTHLKFNTEAERAYLMALDKGFTYGCFASLTGDVNYQIMSNPDIVKSTFSDDSSVLLDFKNHVIKLNVKAELKEVSN